MNWITVASLSGTLAVILGAFGAHGLKDRLSEAQLASWSTATQYQLLHSVALLALALFAAQSGRQIRLTATLWSVGMLCFSGSIYLLLLTSMRWLGPVTPIGGLLLIAGWLALLTLATPT